LPFQHRALFFSDEKQKISEVLMNAVREDLPQAKKLKVIVS
jgi:hypothetical protein